MGTILKIVKWLKDPHGKRMEELKGRYKDLNDLSQVAAEIGDQAAYHSLQTEMKEVFFEIFSLAIIEGVYWLMPHILLIALLSIRFSTITLFGHNLGIYIWYPCCAILLYLIGKGKIGKTVTFLRQRVCRRSLKTLTTGAR